LYLDLADLAAQDHDFRAAADLVREGLSHNAEDSTLRAAGAAYRFLADGSPADFDLLLELAPDVPHEGYRNDLVKLARDRAGFR
jgi:hypothetical protein